MYHQNLIMQQYLLNMNQLFQLADNRTQLFITQWDTSLQEFFLKVTNFTD